MKIHDLENGLTYLVTNLFKLPKSPLQIDIINLLEDIS